MGTKLNCQDYFTVGDRVYCYCCGAFGRDDYNDKICMLVTRNYAVFETVEGGFGSVLNLEDIERYTPEEVEEWKHEEIGD